MVTTCFKTKARKLQKGEKTPEDVPWRLKAASYARQNLAFLSSVKNQRCSTTPHQNPHSETDQEHIIDASRNIEKTRKFST